MDDEEEAHVIMMTAFMVIEPWRCWWDLLPNQMKIHHGQRAHHQHDEQHGEQHHLHARCDSR